MKVSNKSNDDGVFLSVEGRVDTTNYNEFEKAVNEVFTPDVKEIYLDCSELSYISSSGLRIFLTVQKKMMVRAGKFKLYALQPGIQEIFDISGFSSIFSIFNNEDEAKQG